MTLQTNSVRRALSSLRLVRLSSADGRAGGGAAAAADAGEEGLACGGGKCGVDDDASCCADHDALSCAASAEEVECGVCLDHGVEVAFAGCEHRLCIECARNLTKQEKKPPSCPFCRRMVVGFVRLSPCTPRA